MTRDFKTNPKRGDVFQTPLHHRNLEICEVSPDLVSILGRAGTRMIPMALCSRNNWHKIADQATVIHLAQ